MKVLQFAFDSREESNYLPHNYPHNCVVYTGTHDNNTVRGWLDDMCEEDNALAEDYMNNADTPKDERPWEFIRLALGSVADLAVIPLQDYLCLGTEARINLPSTLGNNWKWRLVPGQVTDEMLEKMCHLNKLEDCKRERKWSCGRHDNQRYRKKMPCWRQYRVQGYE